MTVFAIIDALLYVLGGLLFVCLVTALFVVIAKVLAPRLLNREDGSSLDD